MIEEYNDNGRKAGRVNGSMNGDLRKNGISLSEFEELCANLKAQQVSIAARSRSKATPAKTFWVLF